MRKIDLDIALSKVYGLTETQCLFFKEAAVISLLKQGYQSGVVINITGDIQTKTKLIWSTHYSQAQINSWREIRNATHHGAVGLSIALLKELLEYKTFEESGFSSGIDFWIKKTPVTISEEKLVFEKDARLEISGITTESKTNTIDIRLKQKLEQSNRSDHTGKPAWISIVEFATPKAKIHKK